MSTPRIPVLLALGTALLLVSACKEPDSPDFGGTTPVIIPPGTGPSSDGGTSDGGSSGSGDGGIPSKPSCTGGATCAGACPDGGVVCVSGCGFLAPVTYRLSDSPRPKDIAVGDLNGDGFDDIVTANSHDDAVAVLLNRQAGNFQPPTLLPAGSEPWAVRLDDSTGDGILDILSANQSTGTLVVFPNSGNGQFLDGLSTSIGYATNDMGVGAFGGSAHGVALLGVQSSKLTLLRSNGNGTFQTPMSSDAGTSPDSLVVADFNVDGRPDLAITHAPCTPTQESCASVGVLLGNADGTFQTQRFTAVSGWPRGIVSGDFNVDNLPDVAVADSANNRVLVFRGTGSGAFLTPTAYAAPFAPGRLFLADVDRDNIKDLLVTSSTDNRVIIYLGRLDGTFALPVLINATSQNVGLEGLAVSDFDKDGFKDMAVINSQGVQMLWGVCR